MKNDKVDTSRFEDLDRWSQMSEASRAAAEKGLIKSVQDQHDKGVELLRQALDWNSFAVGGRRVMTVHRMGDKIERVTTGRIGGGQVVMSAVKDLGTGRLRDMRVFGMPLGSVDPRDVAEAWGVKLSSPFADTVPIGVNRATREAWDKKRSAEEEEKARVKRIVDRRRKDEELMFSNYTSDNWTPEQWDRYNALTESGKARVFRNVLTKVAKKQKKSEDKK